MLSENNRHSEYKPARKKNTARKICIYISLLSFVLICLVVALPLIPIKDKEKAENEALSRLEDFIKDMDEDMAFTSSAEKSTDNIGLPEVVLDNNPSKETQVGVKIKVIPKKDAPPALIYTLQAGSFDDLQSARKLYDFIINDLTAVDLAYLRIEKVGQYYVVRIGKFGERSDAEIFHDKVSSHLTTAIIMEAYIKKERIKKLHSS